MMIYFFRLTLLWCTCFLRATGIALLAFGDSVDRMMAVELCNVMADSPGTTSFLEEGWGGTTLKYEYGLNGQLPSAICTISNSDTVSKNAHSFAFVQFFGSRPHGPYQVSNLTDPLVDTEPRMTHAYAAYVSRFGHPDILQLHFATWAATELRRHEALSAADLQTDSEFFRRAIQEFEHDMRARIIQALDLIAISSKTRLSLRTGVWRSEEQHLMPAMNAVLRKLAQEMQVDLFDLDMDTWSTVDYNYKEEPSVLRDNVHPRTPFILYGAWKALRLQYSKYYVTVVDRPTRSMLTNSSKLMNLKTNQESNRMARKSTSLNAFNTAATQAWLVASNNAVMNTTRDVVLYASFYNNQMHTRHAGLTTEILQQMKLGPGDVMPVSEAWLRDVPVGAPFNAKVLTACRVLQTNTRIPFTADAIQNRTKPASQHLAYWIRLLYPAYNGYLLRIPSAEVAHALSQFFQEDHVTPGIAAHSDFMPLGTGYNNSWTINDDVKQGIINPCLNPNPSTGIEGLLPLGLFSPNHAMHEAPFHMNQTEGMLLRFHNHRNVYWLTQGVRKHVTQNEIEHLRNKGLARQEITLIAHFAVLLSIIPEVQGD